MPEIARSLKGKVVVTMNYSDHNPPHFHVRQGRSKAIVYVKDAVVGAGSLPKDTLYKVLAWCVSHKKELLEDWELARRGLELKHIDWTID